MKSISTERSFADLIPFSEQLHQHIIDTLDNRYVKAVEAENKLSSHIDYAMSCLTPDQQLEVAKALTDIMQASIKDSTTLHKLNATAQLLDSLSRELQAISTMSDIDVIRNAIQVVSSQVITVKKTLESK